MRASVATKEIDVSATSPVGPSSTVRHFAQLTFRESFRDIETCLRALDPKLYHAGFRGAVSRSKLADASRVHDWRLFADLGQALIERTRKLYADQPLAVELKQTACALDSTTIDLCLSLFPWARFRKHKGAVKLHTPVDLRGNIPCFVRITHGKTHDVNVLDHLLIIEYHEAMLRADCS
jgi:hypothetical protein